jgi:DNA-binding transcriptional ArsR family regulator
MRNAAREEALSEQFKAIAHPLRLRILEALALTERNVGEIEQSTGIGQPGLSQQLSVLRKAGLVETRKDAKLVFYRLATSELGALTSVLQSLLPRDQPLASGAVDTRSPVASGSAPKPTPGVANFARLS